MPEFSISNHANEQMKFRNVSLETVMSVLTNPQQVLTQDGRKIYQSIINFVEEGDYLVRVFVNIEVEPNNVITIYRTSKIDKYYEG
ncbi:MAG: DUF4258 domain-containing protein [Chitinophagaceae bacterium]|nr:DUF4258 domain-containing protein [Chitinophagaceae bacterium]